MRYLCVCSRGNALPRTFSPGGGFQDVQLSVLHRRGSQQGLGHFSLFFNRPIEATTVQIKRDNFGHSGDPFQAGDAGSTHCRTQPATPTESTLSVQLESFAQLLSEAKYAELVTFPHSKHDDQVDVLAYAARQIAVKEQPRFTGPIDADLYKTPRMTTTRWSG